MKSKILIGAALAALTFTTPATARIIGVQVHVQNLAPTNSIAFAPLRFGFNNGTFDSFNNGGTATAGIVSVAEGGSGSAWFPAFSSADPMAVLGSTMGALLPGASSTTRTFRVNTAINPFFTFGAMVIPSNDFFIGNDNPMEYRLFDAAGNLRISQIDQSASDIWNAGSEAFDPANAAFLVGGNNGLRTPENGVVGFNFSELARFDGRTTAAGYTFRSNLFDNTAIYRISFTTTAVPEPGIWAQLIFGFGGIGALVRRTRRSRRQHVLA